ncbi:MAG: 50S ribosomal protein L13 [Candidatus Eremiobacteraeota bacterium]|nr:50S ribosomal protein L13 [Candidatus Eremiobacteraeota bacterium]MBV9264132.1 50S ribosomal protein L13 [Candidatus Eremiobacteraeota bacterium]
MRTYQQTTAQTEHQWYIVDAAGQRLGTLAVRVARALSGKHKPTWTPHIDDGDHVIVVNAEKIELGGKKWTQKLYYRHSNYPGGLKVQTAREIADRHPERLIEKAVRGMLAPNRMRDAQLRRLNVYAGVAHPHEAQKPMSLPEGRS